MKQRLLFSMIIVTAFIFLTVSQSYARLDVLREIDSLVDASKPNVLIIMSTGQFMSRAYNVKSGNPNTNTGDTDTSSRFYMVKDVLRDLSGSFDGGILEQTKDVVEYGLMAYNQTGYYPYFTENCQDVAVTCSGSPDTIESTYEGTTSGSEYYTDFADFSNGELISSVQTGGKLWTAIGGGLTDVKAHLDLQNNGGIVIDGQSNGDTRPGGVFRLTTGNTDSNNAYDYFNNVVISGSTTSKNGCFYNNYIIYISDGFMNSGANGLTAAENGARDLLLSKNGSTSTPVKTFVIGVIDKGNMANERSRLNSIAFHGGTDASDPSGNYGLRPKADGIDLATATPIYYLYDSGSADCVDPAVIKDCYKTSIVAGHDYAFFVTSPEEIYDALKDIIDAIAGGDFVTGSPSATSTSGSFILNNVGMLASTEYPEWRGHIRSVDLVNDYFHWDAGVSLVIPTADAKLPKAFVDARAGDKHTSWRDTDGDGSVDQPPLMITAGSGEIYRYTNRVLYCKTANYDSNCVSSALISNEYVGTTASFNIGGTETSYTYKGAFYMPPYEDRKIYTSNLSGTVLDISLAVNLGAIKTLAGWGALSNDYVSAILDFARGAIDANKDGNVDTGVDLNEDGDTLDTVNSIVESTAEVTREWWLGDVTNVVTVGVGKPINPKDGLSGRDTFREAYADRRIRIYTGSNDQMLHAYDFDTGMEEFAYIPPDLLSNLKTLYDNAMAASVPEAFMGQPANPTDHVYGVASSPKVNDVQIDDNGDGTYQTNEWHTVLVSGEGPGGNHYFALDVTDPSKAFGTATAPGVPGYTLLWHTIMTSPNLAASYGSTLGETWSVPAFGRIKDGAINKWVVFAGSGYDDTSYGDGKGEIFHVINVADGTLLTSSSVAGNFFMAGSSPTVQYGLLPDSVTMIQKSGSKVEDGYQVDLKGRVYNIDTSNTSTASWNKTELIATLGSSADYTPPTTAKPFYYSPSIWDFDNTSDTSKHLMVLGSGTYDDPEMERRGDDDDGKSGNDSNEEGDSLRNPTIGADLTTTLYFTIVKPTTPAIIDAFSIEISAVSGTEVKEDGSIGSTVAAGTLTGARLVASPVLFNNEVSTGTFELQALFLVFAPPAAGQLGCSFGNSYLLVFNLGNADTIVNSGGTGFAGTTDISNTKSGKAEFVVSMGTGKVSGIGVAGGGSHVVVGQSGYGGGDTSGFNIAGGATWNPIGTTTKLFWKEE